MRRNTRVTFAMRDLDRVKCIQAVIEGDLETPDRLGITTRVKVATSPGLTGSDRVPRE